MRIALIHSNQPNNQYAGVPTGIDDSEQAWMRRLALQVAPLLGAEVEVGPVGPDFNTNVRWANARHAVKPFDLLISLHSNAAGDAMVLWGTSKASERYGRTIMNALNADNPVPGDTWTYYDRKVAEVSSTNMPAVLLEMSRHDRTADAQALRDRINNGTLAAHVARVLNRALGLTSPASKPPASTTQEDFLMALTDSEQRRILDAAHRIMGGIPAGSAEDRTSPDGRPARVLDSEDGDYLRLLIERQGAAIAALTETVAQLGTGQGVDPEVIRKAVADAIASIETTVSVRPTGLRDAMGV